MSEIVFSTTKMTEDFNYQMTGPFRIILGPSLFSDNTTKVMVFERLQDAINQFVADALPVTTIETAVVQDSQGVVLVGYTPSDHRINGMHWWGTRQGYDLLSAHPDVPVEDVVLWELEAQGELDDLTKLS